jgi:hypothetical protein
VSRLYRSLLVLAIIGSFIASSGSVQGPSPVAAQDQPNLSGFRLPFDGWARTFHTPQTHSGRSSSAIDFVPRNGLDAWDGMVLATQTGEVFWVGTDASGDCDVSGATGRGFGNLLVIEHENGLFSYYSHLRDNPTQQWAVGDEVTKGEELGMYGTTGCSTGNHLHFEIRTGVAGTIHSGQSIPITSLPYVNNWKGYAKSAIWSQTKWSQLTVTETAGSCKAYEYPARNALIPSSNESCYGVALGSQDGDDQAIRDLSVSRVWSSERSLDSYTSDDYEDRYYFNIASDSPITFYAISGPDSCPFGFFCTQEFVPLNDMILDLFDSNYNLIATSIDDSVNDLDAVLTIDNLKKGTYLLIVASEDEGTRGEYELRAIQQSFQQLVPKAPVLNSVAAYLKLSLPPVWVKLSWVDNSNNEKGFRVIQVDTKYTKSVWANTQSLELKPKYGSGRCYYVEAFNDWGVSKSNEKCWTNNPLIPGSQ